MRTVYLALGLLLLTGLSWGQESNKENSFGMPLQIRTRAEYRNGSLFPRSEGDEAAAFINNRARLSMEYRRADLSMKLSAQYVGVWGQDAQIDKNGRFIMNEAWARLAFGKGLLSIMKDVKLSAGYSIMRGTSTMDIVEDGNHKRWQDWGWLSLNINPQIFYVLRKDINN